MKGKIKYLALAIVVTGLFSSCKTSNKVKVNNKVVAINSEIDELYGLMQGSYDSNKQATEDSSYYDITLHMYPIWENDVKSKWLYVEQSVSSMQDRPYRQRVYKVESNKDGTYSSYVYTLKDDSLYIGKWQDPSFFDELTPNILDLREGCEVILGRNTDGSYEGSTRDKTCKSSLRGATYAASKVRIEKGLITSWDQGFDDNDEQVWGAVDGPYIFILKQDENAAR